MTLVEAARCSSLRSDNVGARGKRRHRTPVDRLLAEASTLFRKSMVQEKVDAAAEALATLVGGGSVEAILIGYRQRVTLNARRLSLERKTR